MWLQAICIFVMWQQEVFPEVEKSIKFLFLHYDNNDSVATKVANVAIRTIWLDSTALYGGAPNFSYFVSKSCLHSLIQSNSVITIVAITNKYWRSDRVWYNQVWLYINYKLNIKNISNVCNFKCRFNCLYAKVRKVILMTDFHAQFLILWTSNDEHANRLFETPYLTYVSYKNTCTYIFCCEILLKNYKRKKMKKPRVNEKGEKNKQFWSKVENF